MPGKKTIRVRLTLHGANAKVFTSEGPLVTGSVLSLPVAEAERLVDLGCAQLTADDDLRVEPEVNIEGRDFEGNPKPPAETETAD